MARLHPMKPCGAVVRISIRIRSTTSGDPATKGFIGCSRAIQALRLTDRLGEIEAPTLIIVGANDMGTPVALSERMREQIRGSELVVLEAAAHLSNVEQAERFNEAVTGFLRDEAASAALPR